MLSPRLHNLLDEHHAPYQTLIHDRTLTAHETAAAAHVHQQQFAKTVMLKVDGDLAMMVMPAAYRIDLTRLSRALGGGTVELASESEFKGAFPDYEVGAMPPFGHLYGMPVYVDSRLAQRGWRDEIRAGQDALLSMLVPGVRNGDRFVFTGPRADRRQPRVGDPRRAAGTLHHRDDAEGADADHARAPGEQDAQCDAAGRRAQVR